MPLHWVAYTTAVCSANKAFFPNPKAILFYNGFPWWAAVKSCKDLRASVIWCALKPLLKYKQRCGTRL